MSIGRAMDGMFTDIVFLVVIETPAGNTYRFCDRIFKGGSGLDCILRDLDQGADGPVHEYLPYVTRIDGIASDGIDPITGASNPPDSQIVFMNRASAGEYSNVGQLFSFEGGVYSEVYVYLQENGQDFRTNGTVDENTAQLLFRGSIEDIGAIQAAELTVSVSSLAVSLTKKFDWEIITPDLFQDVDPDWVDRATPVVYGEALRVPMVPVDAGAVTKLSRPLADTSTTANVTEAARFPSSGIVVIDAERIKYTGKTDTTLTGLQRGQDSTLAEAHNSGAAVVEVQTEYVYTVRHAVKAVGNVYVDGVLQPPDAYDAYTGRNGDDHSKFPGRGVVAFKTKPTIVKQVNLEIEDNISVTDPLSVDVTNTITFEVMDAGDGWYKNLAGGDRADLRWETPQGGSYVAMHNTTEIMFQFYANPGWGSGTMKRRRGLICLGAQEGSNAYKVDLYYGRSLGSGGTKFKTINLGPYSGSGEYWRVFDFDVPCPSCNPGEVYFFQLRVYNGTEGYCHCAWAKMILDFVPDAEKTDPAYKSGTVALQGNTTAETVIGASVSANIDGHVDGSGNLIKRPDLIIKDVLTRYCNTGDIFDAESYAYAAQKFDETGFSMAVVLPDRVDIHDLLDSIAMQARCYQVFYRGKHILEYINQVPDVEVKGLSKVEKARILSQTASVDDTRRADVVNVLSGMYNKFWDGSTDDRTPKIVDTENAESIGKYGRLVKKGIDLGFLKVEAEARRTLEFMAYVQADPLWEMTVVGSMYLSQFAPGQLFKFIMSGQDELWQELGGVFVPGAVFRVLEVSVETSGWTTLRAVMAADESIIYEQRPSYDYNVGGGTVWQKM